MAHNSVGVELQFTDWWMGSVILTLNHPCGLANPCRTQQVLLLPRFCRVGSSVGDRAVLDSVLHG